MKKIIINSAKSFMTNAKTFMKGEGALRLCSIALLLFIGCGLCFADGFDEAAAKFKTYKPQVEMLMKAIAACIAVVGAFTVYFKMQNGDQDVKKTIMMTIGGCVAFVALAEMLPAFFN